MGPFRGQESPPPPPSYQAGVSCVIAGEAQAATVPRLVLDLDTVKHRERPLAPALTAT
jgi:hypothetical protein